MFILRVLQVTNSTKTIIDPWFEIPQAKEYKTYSNFEKAYTAFLDIAISSMVILEPAQDEYTNYNKGFDKYKGITNRFKAYVYSAQKINSFDDLDIKAWYYPYGIKAPLKENWRFEITTFIYNFPDNKYNFDKDNVIPNCIVDFGLPPEYYWNYRDYIKGEVLFTCRLRVDDNQFTPTVFNKEKRYIFGYAQIFNQIDNNIKHMTSIFTAHRYQQRFNVCNIKLLNTTKEEAEQKPKIIAANSIKLLESYRIK